MVIIKKPFAVFLVPECARILAAALAEGDDLRADRMLDDRACDVAPAARRGAQPEPRLSPVTISASSKVTDVARLAGQRCDFSSNRRRRRRGIACRRS